MSKLSVDHLDRQSPYARSKTERVLYNIAAQEQSHSEAREHLQRAIDAGGLTPEEVSAARSLIGTIDAALSAGR